MHDERVLLESRSLRDSVAGRIDALGKVKALELLPDGLHVTTHMVATYFEVSEQVVHNLAHRHREELRANGMRVLKGADLEKYQTLNLKVSSEDAASYPQPRYPQRRSSVALYTRRTVLNVAMLLRDSPVARRVRTYLLDTEADGRHASSLEGRLSAVESLLGDIGPALRDLGPLIHRMSVRLESVERRVDNTDRVVCAMSERLADVATDLKDLRSSGGTGS